jgi:hypothetical protein
VVDKANGAEDQTENDKDRQEYPVLG